VFEDFFKNQPTSIRRYISSFDKNPIDACRGMPCNFKPSISLSPSKQCGVATPLINKFVKH